ncbi:CoA-acylating methylmalonate-semialdehyde dehydrogenase [Pelomonas aquatica]|jgi:malonate-semialdehyde dehydrogenase (acetylating)/methylmalonate-semialdehyde dehydrogenase|uniref:methylmalonate-semialdehyde dehydrogenase (CoA acylating) n=1 Tax=Pelomonas aquatica TaxID=431058 RepID=A0A9X4LHD2_9BURK|nr:CoA-acylating methylmalonate-semialdehyde dehydrogenase [Pelomonas aquatica]MCY4756512.1 CoA-acylating methylmalonate-semialdehyde dehydrogenase [Pelomonas aquatica]MDG0863540.1 CoA-acylating methylmalonate-semialdehyde dehydrogenase [Pelomonas aquatica]
MSAYEVGHWIHGAATRGSGERQQDIYNPATGAVQGRLLLGSAADLDAAVAAATLAAKSWGQTPPLARARVLFKFLTLLQERREQLAEALVREHGKTLPDALGEVARGIEVVEFATAMPQLLKGEYTEQIARGMDAWSMRQPLGVVAGITPFNFPAMVPMWMYPIAIGCGNAFILKPSERDPSASLLMAQWLKEAGLPDGIFSVIQGDKDIVDAILAHPGIAAVSFVGSTPVAEHIYKVGTAHGKRVQALGGAKNHMVVMPDADLDGAVDALMGAAYGSAGERCMAISVAVAVGDVGDRLVAALAPKVKALKIGEGHQPGAEMGPLITRASQQRVERLIGEGIEAGAKAVVDGRGLRVPGHEDGFFVGGTILDGVGAGMSCYTEEIFGPVLCVVRVPDLAAAIALIEANEYANGVAIFTRDGHVAREFVHHIQVGMVGVNVPLPVPMAFNSFGGWKRSLFGDHHAYGPEAVRFYTKHKAVMQRWPDSTPKGPQFAFPQNA